ncbi:hypothetical protein C8R47DRAFT_1064364 [Mycena vitilis]|nr:hypothetical protein C8R47DRAFT_1064364 [Mycena vitilis]
MSDSFPYRASWNPIIDAHPPPPNSEHMPPYFHGLLHMGCTVVSETRMQCNECDWQSGQNCYEMWYHLIDDHKSISHFYCGGYPLTFMTLSGLRNHDRRQPRSHFKPARTAFLAAFNRVPEVVQKRAECGKYEEDWLMRSLCEACACFFYSTLHSASPMLMTRREVEFEKLFKAHCKELERSGAALDAMARLRL